MEIQQRWARALHFEVERHAPDRNLIHKIFTFIFSRLLIHGDQL